MKKALFITLLVSVLVFSAFAEAKTFSEVSNSFFEKLDAWNVRYNNSLKKKDVLKQQNGINDITDEILDIIGDNPAINYKKQILEAKLDLQEKKNEYNNLLEKQSSAKESRFPLFFWVSTKDELQKNIENLENEIFEQEFQVNQLKNELQDCLKQYGIILTTTEIDFLVMGSCGSDVLELCVTAKFLASILKQFEDEIIRGRNEISLKKKYYCLERLALDVELRAVYKACMDVDAYLMKLQKLSIENDKLITETQKKLATTETNSLIRKGYEANIDNQTRQKSVMSQFRDFLMKYKDSWTEKSAQLQNLKMLVQNSIDTFTISEQVFNLMGDTERLLSELENIDIGEILVLDNVELIEKFESLSFKLSED